VAQFASEKTNSGLNTIPPSLFEGMSFLLQSASTFQIEKQARVLRTHKFLLLMLLLQIRSLQQTMAIVGF